MTPEQAYRVWAPDGVAWSRWAKPVLFAETSFMEFEPPREAEWRRLDTSWAAGEPAAVVVDLPGEGSVDVGLALAHHGYRPVPLFNAAHGSRSVVDVKPIIRRLGETTHDLMALSIPPDAPPAFLLDAGRMPRWAGPSPGSFDNRSLVFPQDFPSANFLHANGLRRAILAQRTATQPQEDLAHVLLRWQEGGIPLLARDLSANGPPLPITVSPPSRFRSVWYRALAMMGLHPNSAGGFGSLIPEMTHTSGFG
jgi:hypothetical protein